DELVFVVGTTNFVESLDPALLRPGRFEFHLHIPYPEADDRRSILSIYNQKMRLQMTPEALETAVRRTNDFVMGAAGGTRYSGDHLNALCRAIARNRLRENRTDACTPTDVEKALTQWIERPTITKTEEWVLATHESGHAIVSLYCEHAPPIERISIASEMKWAFGYVKYADPAQKYIRTVNFYRDQLCISLGAREAERLLLEDISLGATADLESATAIARELVEVHGLGGEALGLSQYFDMETGKRRRDLAPSTLALLDEQVAKLLETERARAERLLRENLPQLKMLRDLLIERKTLDAQQLREAFPASTNTTKSPA
ncbi:MAG: AAA family ATPase, partial [Gemmataceae bacterium]